MNDAHILGLATGSVFGFLLQRGRVLRFEKQLGAMMFQDMTIMKFMLSAMMVGMVGIYLMADAGLISLSIKSMNVGAIVIGGTVFGLGWAIAGYCPGTAPGALCEGRLHALFAIAGMLTGASLYARTYPALKATVLSWLEAGRITLPEVLDLSHWTVIACFWIVSLLFFLLFEKKGL